MPARLSQDTNPPYPDLIQAGGEANSGLDHGNLADAIAGYVNHLLCFILPLSTFLYLATGLLQNEAHDLTTALAWTVSFWLLLLLDWKALTINPKPAGSHSYKFYDGILYLLAGLQIANIIGMVLYINQLRWETVGDILISLGNLIIIRFLVGTSSGTSGIVVAHELIHRQQRHWQLLGRLLLCTVCYDHFDITHKRGHHLNLGMPDDIATARLGESFKAYWRRVYVGYLCYAWQSEQNRLAFEPNHPGLIQQFVHNQVIQGLLIELSILISILIYYGWLAAAMFLYQAISAVRILEAVNYFQHWGLENGQFGKTHGWVTPSWVSRYALIGLTHHIGHHEDELKHYHEIAYSERGPKLPYGYFVMNLWVKLDNASYQKMAVQALAVFKRSQH